MPTIWKSRELSQAHSDVNVRSVEKDIRLTAKKVNILKRRENLLKKCFIQELVDEE
jgi:hypothetical protein